MARYRVIISANVDESERRDFVVFVYGRSGLLNSGDGDQWVSARAAHLLFTMFSGRFKSDFCRNVKIKSKQEEN